MNISGQSAPQELRLLDASGRIVSQWNAATGYTWYLGKLSPGIYFATATDGTKVPLLIVE